MSNVPAMQGSPPAPQAKTGVAKRIVQVAAIFAWFVGSILLGAGRLDWVRGWIAAALWVVGMSTLRTIVDHYDPALLEARAKWRHKDTKKFEKIFFAVYLPLVVTQPLVAGLDVARFRWSSMPFGFVYVGATLFALALAIITRVTIVNPFAEVTVRIQTDRGQTVVTSGPYRFVRHPMYVGASMMFLGMPLVWGSVWALVMGGLIVVGFVWRTAREDETLRRELPKYEEFAARTRYRLLPGVW